MGQIVLRILVSDPSEYKFVLMNAIESQNIVDRVLVVEHNYTHAGKMTEFKFNKLESQLREDSSNSTIEIHSISINERVLINAATSEEMHFNEDLIRSSFLTHCGISSDDLIIAVDADEIIYRRTLRAIRIIRRLFPNANLNVSLQLHQFYYRVNYLWMEVKFRSAVVVSGRVALANPKTLRDSGKRIPIWAGCHLSWVMPLHQMVNKLQNYAHKPEYGHFANVEVLSEAIQNKVYPFDPSRPFTIKVLSIFELRKMMPKSFWRVKEYFPIEYWGSNS